MQNSKVFLAYLLSHIGKGKVYKNDKDFNEKISQRMGKKEPYSKSYISQILNEQRDMPIELFWATVEDLGLEVVQKKLE